MAGLFVVYGPAYIHRMGTKLETIRDLIDGGHTVTGWCGDCGRGADLNLEAVAAKSYPSDGSDEDNTYARFSPAGELSLTIANPDLVGVIEPGQKFYLDFTVAE